MAFVGVGLGDGKSKRDMYNKIRMTLKRG